MSEQGPHTNSREESRLVESYVRTQTWDRLPSAIHVFGYLFGRYVSAGTVIIGLVTAIILISNDRDGSPHDAFGDALLATVFGLLVGITEGLWLAGFGAILRYAGDSYESISNTIAWAPPVLAVASALCSLATDTHIHRDTIGSWVAVVALSCIATRKIAANFRAKFYGGSRTTDDLP